jgi:alanyl-tRNA synthetase
VGDTIAANVDLDKRARTMRHHSVTHLMHKALREVLGYHVQQKGSLVDEDKTRFDFSHNQPMTADEIRRVEGLVNAEILKNEATTAKVMPIDEAQKSGAMMLFGEKYGDEVRVLNIGSSSELCGGTHVARTGDIGLFRIVSEGGVAAGIRRVEAVAGTVALASCAQDRSASRAWPMRSRRSPRGAKPSSPGAGERAPLEKELAQLKVKMATSPGQDLASTRWT